MTGPRKPYQFPYTPTPGGALPPPSMTPAEGTADLWGYFWMALLSTLIIAVTGLLTLGYVRHWF
jgi:hypothetical protein